MTSHIIPLQNDYFKNHPLVDPTESEKIEH
jgi:hypothetical protein